MTKLKKPYPTKNRPTFTSLAYGLGAGGEAGVTKAFDIIRGEIAHNMRLLGCQSITALNSSYVAKYPFETSSMPRVALH